MKLLVDGDILVYRCGFAAQKTHYDIWRKEDCEPDGVAGEWQVATHAEKPLMSFEDAKAANLWLKEQDQFPADDILRLPRSVIEPVANALHLVKLTMERIQDQFPDGKVEVYFSCHTVDNWRTTFYPEYKANRPDRKPFWAQEIRDYLRKGWNEVTGEGLEADDLITMAAHDYPDSVVVTIDKDMDQIPGVHYNWVKDEVYDMSKQDSDASLELQVVTGDRVDNIPGLKGWGAKAAMNWLSAGADALSAYEEVYGSEEEARYNYFLNRALVTLPVSIEHRDQLVEEVQIAKEAYEKSNTETVQETSGEASEPVGGRS